MKAYLWVFVLLFALFVPFLVSCAKEETKSHKEESLEEFLARGKDRKPAPPPGQVLNQESYPAPKKIQGK